VAGQPRSLPQPLFFGHLLWRQGAFNYKRCGIPNAAAYQTLRHTKRCGKPNAAAYQMLQTDADRIFAAVASEETPAVLWSLFWWLFAFIKHIADQMLRNDADRVCSCCPVMMLVQVQAQTQSKQKTWLVIRTASSVFFSIGPQGRVSLHAESTVVQCHAHTHTHAHTHIYTNTHTHTHIHQNGT